MLTVVILVALSPLFVAGVVFVAEVVAGLKPLRGDAAPMSPAQVAIVIPAHDEELGIGFTLAGLKNIIPPSFHLLVVADNCSDRTAQIAREHGVQVLERVDPDRRGKGYALAHARDFLRASAPDYIVIFDADCTTDAASLERLVAATQRNQRPSQAIYLLAPKVAEEPLIQLSSFAFMVRNLVRQRGLQRLSGAVHLTGTGICLTWRQFDFADLATGEIVEDAKLGLDLTRLSSPPQLVEGATVWSLPATGKQTLNQRSRWEGGFIALAGSLAPSIAGEALRSRSFKRLLTAFDLLVPPLALLMLGYAAALVIVALLTVAASISALPLILVGSIACSIGLSVVAAWFVEGQKFLNATALLQAPMYVAWKIPMYLKLARRGKPAVWNRTERQPGTDTEAS